jgi:hypothetical protein
MKEAALVAEKRRKEGKVAKYADVGREIEGNQELGEAELKEKRKVGEDELREKSWTGYEIMAESKRIVGEEAEKRDQIGAEYADEWRDMREVRKDVENEYEDGEEVQEFVHDVEVWEYWEEETIYEEENIREENVEGNLDFAEDRTRYRSEGDHSHSATEPQDYDEMAFNLEVYVHFHDSTGESIEHPDPGTKPSSQTFQSVEEEKKKKDIDVEKREEGDKGEAGRYTEVRDKTGERKVKGTWGFKEIDLQEKTEMLHVDVKETRRIEESVQEMEYVGEGKMDERREMGEARRDVEVEKFGYREINEEVESILEAFEVGLEETRYVDKNTGEVYLNEKQIITETTMEHVLSGEYARDAVDTHEAGQYMARGPTGNDALGISTNEDVEYSGQEKYVDTKVENDVGEKAGEKESKGKSKLPDDKMKHRLEGDHAQDTKERSQKSSHIQLKLDGIIRVYHYTGRHVK